MRKKNTGGDVLSFMSNFNAKCDFCNQPAVGWLRKKNDKPTDNLFLVCECCI